MAASLVVRGGSIASHDGRWALQRPRALMVVNARTLETRSFSIDRLRQSRAVAVHNAEVAELFNRLADLLEIEGANIFRVRAYRRAAQTIEDLPVSVA